jgi:hypothetical protein
MSNVLTKGFEDQVLLNQTRRAISFGTNDTTNDPNRWSITSGVELNWEFNVETTSLFLRRGEDEMGEPRKLAPAAFAEK